MADSYSIVKGPVFYRGTRGLNIRCNVSPTVSKIRVKLVRNSTEISDWLIKDVKRLRNLELLVRFRS